LIFNIFAYFLIYYIFSGDLVILDFLLNESIDVKVNSVIKTNFAQTFNAVAKADSTNGNYVK